MGSYLKANNLLPKEAQFLSVKGRLLKKLKWSKYPNHKSELVNHLNINNSQIERNNKSN